MKEEENGRLVILSGPSCVGKSPLVKALARFHPHWWSRLQPIVLFNSRSPRPGECDSIDYYFRTRDQVEELRVNDRYAVLDVRGDLQAIDLEAVRPVLNSRDALFEGNPFVGVTMLAHPRMVSIPRVSIFLSPLSKEEILYLKAPERNVELKEVVTDVMRRKLLRRARRQKGELSGSDLANIERRAGSAYSELQLAWQFDYVIPNHDGEDSDNWDAFYYPLGEARRALNAFVSLLQGQVPEGLEKWDAQLLP